MRHLLESIRDHLRRRFPPKRLVLDPHCPIVRLGLHGNVSRFMVSLECGHLLAPDGRERLHRRCWKCYRELPRDSRVNVRGHRYVAGSAS